MGMFIAEHGKIGNLPIERIESNTYENCVEKLVLLHDLGVEEEEVLRKTGFLEHGQYYLLIHFKD